jgi:hypothetical protein
MDRQQLIKEIQTLADRIRSNTSDGDSLMKEVSGLYELAVLLKYLPEETIIAPPAVQPEIQSSPVVPEPEPIKKEEPAISEQPQMTIDLFSQGTVIVIKEEEIPPSEPPAPKKDTPKKKKVKDESVAEKLQHNKITDLKSAIGINERFQFINELFDGNMKEYTVALDQINSFSSYDEAESYIANLQEVYKWQTDNLIAENFKELVQRRFA